MGIQIQENVLLASYTTFKIGGPARFFVAVKNEEEILQALEYAKKNKINFFILGGGSNIVVSDNGFEGLVIKMENTKRKIQDETIEVGAGISLAELVSEAAKNGLAGLEWAAGIPGTLGGAVRGNAGAFGGEMAKIIESISAIEISENNIRINKYTNQQCGFGYRTSFFKKQSNLIVTSARMRFEKGDSEKISNEIKEIIRKRVAKQPQGFGSAGSFFKNPVVENKKIIERFEKDLETSVREGKIPAGWLIEESGIVGKKIGGAMISEKHANFIINTGNATAEDVIMLASFVKQQVRDKFGVQLFEEVQYIGF
ncbi:MAG: UDP-N-acetylenolpyruvoylglucosamine reductase [uncultured bacterium]|nr:MAG: UDP-N-acetylenolpyruvoylglucosamine reductase [uncultured bacterium]HBR71954.1 UDP-N-acetylenolpyruvoylglucosamine reductase [Candidatus Moranbacteria bacterium]